MNGKKNSRFAICGFLPVWLCLPSAIEPFWQQIWVHPLTTAGMFLLTYLALSSIRDRLHCSDCVEPNDSI